MRLVFLQALQVQEKQEPPLTGTQTSKDRRLFINAQPLSKDGIFLINSRKLPLVFSSLAP